MASRRIGMFGVEPSEFTDDRNEDGVAALLRRRREELGRDTATVARQLRIRAVYIQAIEEGRLQDLPGTAYAVGFVRAYADYLGLDGNSIVSDYRDELARRSRQNQLIWPVDQVEYKHFPSGIIIAVCLALAIAITGGWYFASQPGGTGIDLIDQVPEFMKRQTGESTADESGGDQSDTSVPVTTPTTAQAASAAPDLPPVEVPVEPAVQFDVVPAPLAELEGGTVPLPGTLPVDAAGTPQGVSTSGADAPNGQGLSSAQQTGTEQATAAATESLVESVGGPVGDTAVDPAASTGGAATVPGSAGGAGAEQSAALPTPRIVLRAAKDSWVEIFDANQKVVLQRILRAGETYAVPEQNGLVMNTGNAGGLVIEVDGRAQPSLGSIGVVKRGISLAPDAFLGQ